MRTTNLVSVLALALAGCGGQSRKNPEPTPIEGGGGSGAGAMGCESKSQSADSGSCEIRYACEQAVLISKCSDLGNGSWGCDCESRGERASYVIRDVTGLSACETIAEICATGGEPAFSGSEECGSVAGSRSTENCQLHGQCTRPLEANPLVSLVTRSNFTISECANDGTAFNCYCDGGREYRILGMDGNTACDLLEGPCRSGAELTGRTCAPISESLDSNRCEARAECTESVSLPTGITEVRANYPNVSCTPLAGGKMRCSCSWAGVSFAFEYEGTTETSCSRALTACLDAPVKLDEGPIECRVTRQTGEGDPCHVILGCTQSGTLGDLEVNAFAGLETICRASEDGTSWSCSCRSSSTGETGTTTAERGTDTWESCAAAADKCREVVDVFPSSP